MRISLIVRPAKPILSIPLSYEYYLSAAIYRWIELSSPTFSELLHNQGFSADNIFKKFKHFCYSQLFPENSFVKNDQLYIADGKVKWFIAIPMEETLKHFMTGIFENQSFFIGSEENRFFIEYVEVLPQPIFGEKMKFKTLSPITASVPFVNKDGKMVPRYLMADDPELSSVLRNNLLARYESLYGKKPENTDFTCETDAEYIKRKGGVNRVSKLVTIKKGSMEETKIRGFRCPIILKGNIELIRFAYNSGLGEKGSMGFGMLEVMKGV